MVAERDKSELHAADSSTPLLDDAARQADVEYSTSYHGSQDSANRLPKTKTLDDVDELTTWQIVRICLPALAVSMGWAVGETLMSPYLLGMGVSEKVCNMIWLTNPIISLFLQPLVGAWSDNCKSSFGRRRPFLLVFHCGSMVGLTAVAFAKQIYVLFAGPIDDLEHAPVGLIAIIFAGFGVADMCHDIMLLPARALLNDQLPESQLRKGNRYFALFTSFGSILGMSMVMLPLKNIPLLTSLDQVSATFLVAVLVVMVCNTFVLSYPEEAAMDDDDDSDSAEAGVLDLLTSIAHLPRQINAIYLAQFMWWYVILNQTFWWTTWISMEVCSGDVERGVRIGVISLLLQAVVSMASNRTAVPYVVERLGLVRTYHLASLTYTLGALPLFFVTNQEWAPILYGALSGIPYPVINSTPYILLEVYLEEDDEDSSPNATCASSAAASAMHTPAGSPHGLHLHEDHEGVVAITTQLLDVVGDPKGVASSATLLAAHHEVDPAQTKEEASATEDTETTRGVLTALMNLCMVAAQVFVAATSGLLIHATGRVAYAFLTSAILGATVNIAIYSLGWTFDEDDDEEDDDTDSQEQGDGDTTEGDLTANSEFEVNVLTNGEVENLPSAILKPSKIEADAIDFDGAGSDAEKMEHVGADSGVRDARAKRERRVEWPQRQDLNSNTAWRDRDRENQRAYRSEGDRRESGEEGRRVHGYLSDGLRLRRNKGKKPAKFKVALPKSQAKISREQKKTTKGYGALDVYYLSDGAEPVYLRPAKTRFRRAAAYARGGLITEERSVVRLQKQREAKARADARGKRRERRLERQNLFARDGKGQRQSGFRQMSAGSSPDERPARRRGSG